MDSNRMDDTRNGVRTREASFACTRFCGEGTAIIFQSPYFRLRYDAPCGAVKDFPPRRTTSPLGEGVYNFGTWDSSSVPVFRIEVSVRVTRIYPGFAPGMVPLSDAANLKEERVSRTVPTVPCPSPRVSCSCLRLQLLRPLRGFEPTHPAPQSKRRRGASLVRGARKVVCGLLGKGSK